MSTAADLDKESNFFEKRPTEYQTGALKWDEKEED
jgi:ribonucleotide reductase beta subunit family protein with ferritin-like domain